MKIKIGRFDYTECWDGVLYKNLSGYPDLTAWEAQSLLDFISYEEANGRSCEIEAEKEILEKLRAYRPVYESGRRVDPPDRIAECTACPKYKGCLTDMVCHTSSLEDAIAILDCGRLLSAVLARKKSAEELRREPRNAAGDPADYFDYVMFAWGNCQAGDRLVTERKLGRAPTELELESFTPGVRFYFRYEEIARHPNAVFDGVLPVKVRDGVALDEWAAVIVAPEEYREALDPHVPDALRSRVRYLEKGDLDIWRWSEKVYELARGV